MAEAKRLGQPALALTDHGVMHGAVEFFRACKEAEIRPIIGVEAYQTVWGRPMGGRDPQFDRENYHLLLLAKNMTGYRNLLKIASHSQLNGYYYRPRIDHDFLARHAEGIVATTGCMGAEVPQLLSQGKEKEAYERLGWYVETFGKENFFIELQEHSIEELRPINRELAPWAGKFGIQLLATNDVHYVRAEDAQPHEVLLCVQTGTTIHDEKRMRLSDQSYFLKSRAQMEATFRPYLDLPASAFDNSLLIAEMCEVDLEDRNYHLPDIDIPEGYTYESYLRKLTEEGLERLYGENAKNLEVQERKERELQIIHQMGFDVYFLIVADLCDFARSRNIWWNVRGSGAGSLVAYCTGITGIDPLKNNLIFERFLNPARVSMPDFDLDYPDDQREEMIRYTVQKYGDDQVAQIATMNRMKARAAIRDVGRATGIELAQVDRIAKMIPAIPGKPVTIQDVLTEGHEFYNPDLVDLVKREKWAQDLVETSIKLEGVARNSGIHAAAVIVADRDLVHYTPLMRASKGSITNAVTQYEFPILESIGLLKVDFLGLSTLTVMREAARLINERHGAEYTLANIPFEGEEAAEAFKLLSSGEVSGVFQVEGQGMRRVLTEMRPTAFEHIVATISLYRPGPLEYIPQFIRRMHGEEEVEFKHPKLESILSETYGILVYQEQIIQVLSQLAGYAPGEADLVRRAVSKKKASDIEKHKKGFVEGCKRNGIPESAAVAIYGDIEFFARYGFNKSHAADYAVICVQTAYLKARYPVEYMAALLLVERDKTEKVINFINECRRMGIDVLPPDVNYSGLDFEIQARPADTETKAHRDPTLGYAFPVPPDSAIRFGMAAVKNVGEGPVQVILKARAEGGPFASLEDFCDRVDLRTVGKRPLECLIKVGALDRFGKRSQLLAVLDQMVEKSTQVHNDRASGQLSIFDLFGDGGAAQVTAIPLPNLEETTGKERLQWEKELLGVYANSHPLQQMNVDWRRVATCSCAELDERYDGKGVALAGMILSVRTINTKKGDQMAFVQIEDVQGQCEVVVFPRTYAEVKDKLITDQIYLFKGKAQSREGQTSLLLESMQTYVELPKFAEEDASVRQTPLLPGLPTFNGVALHEEVVPYANGHLDEDENEVTAALYEADDVDTAEDGSAEDDAPEADGAEAAAERPEAEAPARQQPEASTTTVAVFVSASPAPIRAKNGHAPTLDEINAQFDIAAAEEYEPVLERPLPRLATPKPAQERPLQVGHRQPMAAATPPRNAAPHEPLPPARPPDEKPPAVSESVADDAAHDQTRSAPVSHGRALHITFRRSGDLARDKYRLKEIYDLVRDPRGRDRFFIRLELDGQAHQLAFPNDFCSITNRLLQELKKRFRVETVVKESDTT
ncbi:MAG: DNA polymerase III subunit alpha [Caldilineaceae bacterium]|nr:DNA polymerase III subunit alpha [Caldilineaceae bacterium]